MIRNPNLWSVFSNSKKISPKEDRFGCFKKKTLLSKNEKISIYLVANLIFYLFIKILISDYFVNKYFVNT